MRGEPIEWTNWGSGNPDSNPSNDCIGIKENQAWFDGGCNLARPAICQYRCSNKV